MKQLCDKIESLLEKGGTKKDIALLALWASVYIGETFAAGEVAFIMQLGGLLEELTVARARAGIEKLVHLTPTTARIILSDGSEKIIDAAQVKVGDKLLVKPGETIAVDGKITKGRTSVNQAVMTGESLPVDKSEGDEVFSGTLNQSGAFEMTATNVGEDSSIQRMIRLVQSADAGKAKIVSLADRWAVWIVVGAAVIVVLSFIFTRDIIRSVTVLVVFCPCALVLATPTAIMAAIGNVTKHGFLVREGDALEKLAYVSRITFDKTGTLTYGTPEVTDIVTSKNQNLESKNLLMLVASLEKKSEHPLGKAVVRKAKNENLALFETDNFKMIPGLGVSGKVQNHQVLAGNLKMLEQECKCQNRFRNEFGMTDVLEAREKTEQFLANGSTVGYAAVDGNFAGMIALSDTLRKEARPMIEKLKSAKITPTLLTGDNEKSAAAIAREVGITEVHDSCMPEDKIRFIKKYQANGEKVCIIGDGINDAPSLKTADVGIAMGGAGSDIAVDAADIVLVDDDVKELPHLFALSRHMMRVIKANLTFSMSLNFLAVSLAFFGILNQVWGALVHNAGSVFVIINSSFLLKWKSSRS